MATKNQEKIDNLNKIKIALNEPKLGSDVSAGKLENAFKNILWIVLQRRKDGFFNPLNTTASGEAVKRALNLADMGNLRKFLRLNNGNTEIRYSDLRYYLTKNIDTSHKNIEFNAQYLSGHYINQDVLSYEEEQRTSILKNRRDK